MGRGAGLGEDEEEEVGDGSAESSALPSLAFFFFVPDFFFVVGDSATPLDSVPFDFVDLFRVRCGGGVYTPVWEDFLGGEWGGDCGVRSSSRPGESRAGEEADTFFAWASCFSMALRRAASAAISPADMRETLSSNFSMERMLEATISLLKLVTRDILWVSVSPMPRGRLSIDV